MTRPLLYPECSDAELIDVWNGLMLSRRILSDPANIDMRTREVGEELTKRGIPFVLGQRIQRPSLVLCKVTVARENGVTESYTALYPSPALALHDALARFFPCTVTVEPINRDRKDKA